MPLPPRNDFAVAEATRSSPLEEFEALKEAARERWVKELPNRGMWGGNAVPRGEIRGSYRIIPAVPMDLPIPQGTIGSSIVTEGNGVVEDLRLRYSNGTVERIFTRSS
jgi:hypothetical protein